MSCVNPIRAKTTCELVQISQHQALELREQNINAKTRHKTPLPTALYTNCPECTIVFHLLRVCPFVSGSVIV
eukprot:6072495-Amphidinium_carterae.1